MKMKPSFEADMFVGQFSLNAKKFGYFDASAGFRVALPSGPTCSTKNKLGCF
jgi:hypothetical protein